MNIETRGSSGTGYESNTGYQLNDLSKVLIGALAGAAVGTLIAGSYTQKGKEIRHRVGEGRRKMVNNVKEKVSDMKESIADKYDAAKEGVADLIEKGKQKVGMSKGDAAYKSNPAYTASTGYIDAVEDDETGSGSKVLLGALIASVAGTIVWSLATEKGKETRKRVVKGSKNIVTNIKDKVSDVSDAIADKYKAAKDGAVDLLEQANENSNRQFGTTSYGTSATTDGL